MVINQLTVSDILQKKIFKYLDEESDEIIEVLSNNEILKENSGFYLITGEIKFKDGTIYPAIFEISSDDSGEMFGYYIFLNNEIMTHNDNLEILGKKREEIFPFKYHLNKLVENDVHGNAQY